MNPVRNWLVENIQVHSLRRLLHNPECDWEKAGEYPNEIWDRAASSRRVMIRINAAAGPVSSDTLSRLAQDRNLAVVSLACQNPRTPTEALEEAAGKAALEDQYETLHSIAENPNCGAELADKLAARAFGSEESATESLLRAIAGNKSISAELNQQLFARGMKNYARSQSASLLWVLVENPVTPVENLWKCAQLPSNYRLNEEVARLIAKRYEKTQTPAKNSLWLDLLREHAKSNTAWNLMLLEKKVAIDILTEDQAAIAVTLVRGGSRVVDAALTARDTTA